MKRIAIISSYQEECGAAFYSSRLIRHLQSAGFTVDIKRLPVSLLRISKPLAMRRKGDQEIRRIADELRDYDVALMQFEPGLYGNISETSYPRARWLLKAAKRAIITVHGFHRGYSPPTVGRAAGMAMSRRFKDAINELESISRARSHYRHATRFWKFVKESNNIDVMTFCRADQTLLERFYDLTRVTNYPITYYSQDEVEEIRGTTNRAEILRRFGMDPAKRYFGVYGFLSAYKGHLTAIKALESLPDDWELAIVGGEHPQALEADRDIGGYLRQLLAFPLEGQRQNRGNGLGHGLANVGDMMTTADLEHMQLKEDLFDKSEFKYFFPTKDVLKRIKFVGQVSDDDMARLYTAIDYAVHPYIKTRSGQSGSGPATMALEFGSRSLFSNVPVFREMNQYFEGAMSFFNVGNFFELAESLERYDHFGPELTANRMAALQTYNPIGMVESYRQLFDK